MSYYVYIIANRPNGALYIDVTDDLTRRGCPKREKAQSGFSTKTGRPRLVYFEEFATVLQALAREKVIKACSRDWKLRRIGRENPDWRDLTPRPSSTSPPPPPKMPPPKLPPPKMPPSKMPPPKMPPFARPAHSSIRPRTLPPTLSPAPSPHPSMGRGAVRKPPPLSYPVS